MLRNNTMIKTCFFPGLFLPWSNVLHVEIAFLKFMLFLRYAFSLLDLSAVFSTVLLTFPPSANPDLQSPDTGCKEILPSL